MVKGNFHRHICRLLPAWVVESHQDSPQNHPQRRQHNSQIQGLSQNIKNLQQCKQRLAPLVLGADIFSRSARNIGFAYSTDVYGRTVEQQT